MNDLSNNESTNHTNEPLVAKRQTLIEFLLQLESGRYTTMQLVKLSGFESSYIRMYLKKYGAEIKRVLVKNNMIKHFYIWTEENKTALKNRSK